MWTSHNLWKRNTFVLRAFQARDGTHGSPLRTQPQACTTRAARSTMFASFQRLPGFAEAFTNIQDRARGREVFPRAEP